MRVRPLPLLVALAAATSFSSVARAVTLPLFDKEIVGAVTTDGAARPVDFKGAFYPLSVTLSVPAGSKVAGAWLIAYGASLPVNLSDRLRVEGKAPGVVNTLADAVVFDVAGIIDSVRGKDVSTGGPVTLALSEWGGTDLGDVVTGLQVVLLVQGGSVRRHVSVVVSDDFVNGGSVAFRMGRQCEAGGSSAVLSLGVFGACNTDQLSSFQALTSTGATAAAMTAVGGADDASGSSCANDDSRVTVGSFGYSIKNTLVALEGDDVAGQTAPGRTSTELKLIANKLLSADGNLEGSYNRPATSSAKLRAIVTSAKSSR